MEHRYRAVCKLELIAQIQITGSLRIVPYFCTAKKNDSTRPSFETIVRAVARKLSWRPDFSVAQPAQELYGKATQGLPEATTTTGWKKLLKDVIRGTSSELPPSRHIVILVDALDECASIEDIEMFLEYMPDILVEFPRIYFLCSSRQHVDVDSKLDLEKYQIDVTPGSTNDEMTHFIDKEICFRRTKLQVSSKKPIFCKSITFDIIGWILNSLNS